MFEKYKTIEDIKFLYENLFPLCRSLTGCGVRDSIKILKKFSSFNIIKFPTGLKTFDWEIPKEWLIKEAYIENDKGEKIIDFKNNNLHVVNYSSPIDRVLQFKELEKKLYYLPKLPDAIPYRTTYYNRDWGFCLSFNQFKRLNKNKKYFVKINSSFKNGNLIVGDFLKKGELKKEIILSSYLCHPSMINDNISGMVLWILLLRKLKKIKTKYSYRFVLAPETIGSIAYLSLNEKKMQNVLSGFILSCVSGPGKLGYKKTFLEDHLLDDISINTLKEFIQKPKIYPFDVFGSDERQYSSPFFRIPMGTITKDKYFEYNFYHTSKDNLDFAKPEYLFETIKIYERIIERIENSNIEQFKKKKLENNGKETILSNNPYCEPMLSKRNLYPKLGGSNFQIASKEKSQSFFKSIMWILFYADGKNSVDFITKKSKIPKKELLILIQKLKKVNLIKENV